MKENNLHRTRLKLTMLFTVCIFCIVFVLWAAFFSFRYIKILSDEQQSFISSTLRYIDEFGSSGEVRKNISLDQRLERFDDVFRKWDNRANRSRTRPVSYIVISESGEVLERFLREDIEIETLQEAKRGRVYRDDGVFLRKERITYSSQDAIVYFYKHYSYSFSSYLGDIGIFTIFLLLFSVLFYFLSYKFVGRTLRPVEENLNDMRDFIHNAGHELKTPISVLRGNLQIIQAEKKLDPKLIKQGIGEVDRLNALIEWLIELAETGKNSEKQNLKLHAEITSIFHEFEKLAKTKKVTLENTIPKKETVYANRQELYVLVSNIIKNAITYNQTWWSVSVSFTEKTLSIQDTWIGIEQQDIEKIFERFYQGKTARSQGGFWIGLSLVKKIADANRWKIEVESKKDEGTTFSLTF